ncbi:hypothetical protein Tco_0009520 [Tanacetum coccineum]
MANLDFCDKHNMVAFLKKPEGSEGFHQIVDFLNSTHIKYALTENPTIYVSLIHQFWQTASASTSNIINGHRDHVPACLCHVLYCIETSTKYNLAFFILKRMERIRNNPKVILPYGMLLTRLFNHVVSNFPELAIDRYILYDRVMHPLAPHY